MPATKNKYAPKKDDPNSFIKAIRFTSDFRCYKAGELYRLYPGINLIVGDQGCGKSTLFHSIMNIKKSGIEMNFNPDSSYRFLDTESMNPRLETAYKAHKEFDSVSEHQKAEIDAALDRLTLGYTEQSHGEVILPLLLAAKEKGVTYFIDEPEAGLSIRSQHKVFEHYKKLAKNNQLIIATHSLVFIQAHDKVLSLEHKKWMSSEEFLNTQKIK